jgi:SAM-dependent methyltransferase
MRRINCLICGSDRKNLLAEQRFDDPYLRIINPNNDITAPQRWVSCEVCSFIYHDPQLDSEDTAILYERYRDASFRKETPDEYFDRIANLSDYESENYEKVSWIKEHLPDTAKQGRLLDIGCGGGLFIYTFKKYFLGWSAFGVEPTALFAKLAERRLRETVIAGVYKACLFPGKKFELITINQVLEHVLDPISFLIDVSKDLATDGYVYLETPDIADFDLLPPEHDRFQATHLWYFSLDSLSKVCEMAGFRVSKAKLYVTHRGRTNVRAILHLPR